MRLSLWARLSLRWQAAVAVLVPCVAVALFGSLYFPAQLNKRAEDELQTRARALGILASAEIGPTVRLVEDGLAAADDLDKILRGFAEGGDLAYIAVLSVKGSLDAERNLEVKADSDLILRSGTSLPGSRLSRLPEGRYPVPSSGCQLEDRAGVLLLICLGRDADGTAPSTGQGVLVAGFRKDSVAVARRENQRAGLLSLLVASVGGLILAFLFSRALTTPVALVTQAARIVASGDVTVSALNVSAAGEIRSMASSFNDMLGNLRSLVSQMVTLAGRLSKASTGLLSASRDQDNVTSQQASYAQQIAATFEELSRTAERITASTDVVEASALRTNEAVDDARAVVSDVLVEISHISAESKASADAMLLLNEDLQQVNHIARLINQVAERSDLLALNAALEGTKAGEIGRGFSRVAAEMRKLAESVSGSAQDIGRLVERIQVSGNAAVDKARVGVAAASKGVQVATQASDVFERISSLARETTEAARQISIASRQQRQSSEHAVQGSRNVSDLVKQGVDATGRTHLIAKDLQAVAHALAEVTGKFKVDPTGKTG